MAADIPSILTGGWTVLLVTPDKSLECPICLRVFKDPHLTDCCGHHFCKTCILRVKESDTPCPVCQNPSFNIFPNLEKKRVVGLTHVYCSNQHRGCKWSGELSQLEQHLSLCDYVMSPCSYGCGLLLTDHELSSHGLVCPKGPFMPKDSSMQHFQQNYEDIIKRMETLTKEVASVKKENKGLKQQLKQQEEFVQTIIEEIQLQLEQGRGRQDKMTREQIILQNQLDELSRIIQSYQMKLPQLGKLEKLDDVTQHHHNVITKLESRVNHMITSSSLTPPIRLDMPDFYRHKNEGTWWQSKPFYSHQNGYKFRLEVKASGNGAGAGTHLSVYVHVMQGEFDDVLSWPLLADVHFRLLNQFSNDKHFNSKVSFTKENEASMRVLNGRKAGTGRGYSQFIPLSALSADPAKNTQYLKNDSLRFEVIKVVFP